MCNERNHPDFYMVHGKCEACEVEDEETKEEYNYQIREMIRSTNGGYY